MALVAGGDRVVHLEADAARLRSARRGRVSRVGARRRHLDRQGADPAVPALGRARRPVGMQQLLADQGYLPIGYEAGSASSASAWPSSVRTTPPGIVFAAILWGVLARGETAVQIQTDVPREFVIILQGILIISVVVTYQVAQATAAGAGAARAAAEVEDLEDAAASADTEGLAKEDR